MRKCKFQKSAVILSLSIETQGSTFQPHKAFMILVRKTSQERGYYFSKSVNNIRSIPKCVFRGPRHAGGPKNFNSVSPGGVLPIGKQGLASRVVLFTVTMPCFSLSRKLQNYTQPQTHFLLV